MKISGFSFAWNTHKLQYPVAESIRSILPICDEFVVAVGKGDPDDRTRELIEEIDDPKIRIIDTDWERRDSLKRYIYSQQTNLALNACSGDWCFYIQADEVVHEKYLPTIRNRCEKLLADTNVEGMLFSYKHFWGDYDHYLISHRWYPSEVRIVRNGLGVESRGDAQSFRRNGEKLRVAAVDAEIFHYGYVRSPSLMQERQYQSTRTYHGKQHADNAFGASSPRFDYGSLEKIPRYTDAYPAVMKERIAQCDWKDELQYSGESHVKHAHDRLKYRILTFIEQNVLGGRQLGGRKNYILLRGKR